MLRARIGFKRIVYAAIGFILGVFILAIILLNIFFPVRYKQSVFLESDALNLDPSLVYAVIWAESKFDTKAVSPAGARGLMQMLPATAEWCCKKLNIEYDSDMLFDDEYNIKLGTYYLNYLLEKYAEETAIAAYNAGEGNISKWDGEIKFKETKDYTKRVTFARKIYNFRLFFIIR